ncbi:hypothetical protein [Azospirillum soli]|uniref:hypothetical protein n=1 Tax=Azospirillum soli TaxID=1304799 RepID=UPI001AE9874F|nr:hypothetical protein [Azospirillum soli]MBP2311123.1 hypothetical protein [Azospirillum soli]
MPEVEISREDTGRATVFEAIPATMPPLRYIHLLYAALMVGGFVLAADLFEEPTATMIRWLAALCVVPVLLLWVLTLWEAARRRAVRLAVTPEGLLSHGHVYPHETIRDLALYAPGKGRPLFVARIAPVTPQQHKAELELVTGEVGVDLDALRPKGKDKGARGRSRASGFRLVMHRRDHRPAIVLVRGLTLSGGETLFAALAAELRKHSR